MKLGRDATAYRLLDSLERVDTAIIAGHGLPGAMEARKLLARYNSVHVHCMEPQADLYRGCVREYSGYERITMHPFALSNHDGKSMMHISNRSGWSSLHPINSDGKIVGVSGVMVDTFTLDTFCISYDISVLNLLMLDVQGYEDVVLSGADRLIQSGAVDVVVGESVFTNMYGNPHSFYNVYDQLAMRNDYTFVGWYMPTKNDWGRVKYCDYIFARDDIVEGMQ